jgi:NAD(P)-dependent dehydrogenase (short-subunit alcohol dehydrogenase family)
VAQACPDGAVTAVAGDVTSPAHRAELVAAVQPFGQLDLLMNNAAQIGPSPGRTLAEGSLDEVTDVFAVNVFAPLALMLATLPALERGAGAIVNLSSVAAREPQARFGAYCSTKAALDMLTAIVAVEAPSVRAYALDPGQMRTDLHQQVFLGEDVSDRPEPESVVPAVLRLLAERPVSGRYLASDLVTGSGALGATE